jgi:hypothetical protein
MESKKSIFKYALGIILGIMALAGVCTIAGCGGGGGGGGNSGTVSPTAPDERGLPPNPGRAGKATLAGIDSDGDGVRDDIQRYIAKTYPDSAKTRELLTRHAKLNQAELLDSADKALSIQHAREEDIVQQCLWYVINSDKAIAIRKDLAAEYLNTKERSDAYLLYDSQLGGEVFGLMSLDKEKQTCSYLDALPN